MAKYSKAKATFIKASNTMRILVSLPSIKLAAGFDVQLARNKAFHTCAYTQAICSQGDEYKHKKAFSLLRFRLDEGRSIPMENFVGNITLKTYSAQILSNKEALNNNFQYYVECLAQSLVSGFMEGYAESIYGHAAHDSVKPQDDSTLGVKVEIV